MKKVLALVALAVAVAALNTGSGLAADQPFQETLVTPGNGGGIMSDNGQVVWSIPANAYPTTLRIRYSPNSALNYPATPSTAIWIGQPFTIQMFDYDTGSLVSSAIPTTLRINFRPPDLGGRSESTLRIAMLAGTQWMDLPSTVDTINHVVTTLTPYSGDYGLLASNVGAPGPAVATPAPAPAPAAPAPAAPGPAAPAPAPAPAAPTSSVVSGQVFFDKDGNGVMDGGDFPIGGAGVLISSGSWFSFARTGPDGRYSFSGLGNGTYQVNVLVGPEWAFTTPFAITGIGVTGQQGSNGNANFGMWYGVPQ
jgi:hypothetical protein